MTGHLRITNDGSKILGNEIDNCGVKGYPFNNNHLIYIQCGADNIEVAYNYFHDDAAGHCIQVHADDPGKNQYDNVRIHSNLITSDGSGDMRGPTMSNVLPDSTLYYYSNVVANIGAFSAFNLVNGTAYIYNNTFYSIGGGGVLSLMSDNGQHMVIKNNIMWSNGTAPYVFFGSYSTEYSDWSNVTIANNIYFNNGDGPTQDSNAINSNPLLVDPANGDYKLQALSPARDSGYLLELFPYDYDNIIRPQGISYDIGAFEYVSAAEETCSDNIQNQDETGIDCGGVCEACVVLTTYTLTNFISIITNWLGIGNETSDVNSDGIVNTRDLGVMMSGWSN